MPALVKTEITGTITWLGYVADRDASLASTPLSDVMATFAGVAGEEHAGLTRPSCSRVLTQYKRDTPIRNTRQFSIVSAEELADIAAAMGIQALNPAWLGASMVVSGIPDFTHVPPGTRLQTQAGTTLTVDMENQPCHLPAKVIEAENSGAFKSAAKDRRGVTAWVEREGLLRIGDTVSVHIPGQRPWQPE